LNRRLCVLGSARWACEHVEGIRGCLPAAVSRLIVVRARASDGGSPMSNVSEEIERLFNGGEEFVYVDEYADALARFNAAWDLLPEPKEEGEMAVQILAAIADCHFFLKEWDACRKAVQHAFQCGAELDNPFFRLRLGQSLYELGDEREAANWLVPIYLTEGRKPFEREDPKYLEFFRDKLRPPEGGWPEGW